MAQKKHITSIIKAYMDGKSGKETDYKFQQWITGAEERASKDEALEEVWDECRDDYSSSDKKVWASVCEDLTPRKESKTRLHIILLSISGIAAAFIAGIFIERELSPVVENEAVPYGTICYVTAKDSKGEFILPDGTSVWLNGSSSLKFSDGFSGDSRLVSLEGEGFFDVAHDPDKPFIVDIGERQVEAIGTAFDVKNYKRLDYQEVVLVRGSVKIADDEGDFLLNPNERFTALKDGDGENVTTVDTGDYSHWMDRVLRFDNKPLRNIIINLEHWYNMEFIVDSKVDQNTRLSFNVKYEPVDEILRAMSMVSSFRYRIDYENNKIYLTAKR